MHGNNFMSQFIMVIGLSGDCKHTSDQNNRTIGKWESDLLITQV